MHTEQITRYLPSKHFVITVLLFVIIWGGYYTYNHLLSPQRAGGTSLSSMNTSSSVPERYDQYADNDEDGLANWEEAMWGTNPDNSDTDGDGTSDAIEFVAERNPLVNAANDSLTNYPAIPSLKSAETGYATRTSGIAQAFASQLYALGLSKNDTAGSGSIALNNILKNELVQGKLSDTYTADAVITTNDTIDAYRVYGNTLGTLVATYKTQGEPRASNAIINDAFIRQDLIALTALAPYAQYLQDNGASLVALPVPKGFLTQHVNLVNGMINMGKALDILTKSAGDPFMALLGLSEYTTSYTRFYDALLAFSVECDKQKTTFGLDDPGNIFIQQ
jgi:hypothetical protein